MKFVDDDDDDYKIKSPVFKGKIGVTPLVAAPGDTNPSDATGRH